MSALRLRGLSFTYAGAREPALRETAELISAEAARLYDNMHGLIPRLTPFALDTLGLAVSLENLVRDWQRRFPSVALTVRHEIPADLGPSAALAIYRVVQEGLINALRHAQAKRVDVAVSADARCIAVSVRDDGVGLPEDWSRAGHFGLRGLAERVAQLGGTFAVANASPSGVELRAEIPLGVAA